MKKALAFLVYLLVYSNLANATPLTWYLDGVVFYEDHTTATGSFVFDADTATYSDWDITTVNGYSSGGPISGLNYNPTSAAFNSGNANYLSLIDPSYLITNTEFSYFLALIFMNPLTNAGGTIVLSTGYEYGDNPINRSIMTGAVTTHRIETQEPFSVVLLAMGLLGLTFARRKVG